MGTDHFMEGFTKLEITNLGPCILWTNDFTIKDIPHFNHSVSRSSTCSQESVLMRRPSNCFYSRLVVGKFIDWLASLIPDDHLVVVSSWCKILLISRPLETANLLGMISQFHDKMLRRSNISLKDRFISWSSWKHFFAPRHWTHTNLMPFQLSNLFFIVHVPYKHISFVATNRKGGPIIWPTHRSYHIIGEFAKSCYLRCHCIP